MSTPLVDIDANPRQPGFRSTKEGSKIPGPFKVQQVGGKDRSSPFSVSSIGSPCYNAVPTTSKAVVSSTSASRLPRKSTPVQNSFSRSYTYGSKSTTSRSSLPRCRDGLEQSASTAAPLPVTRTTPPSSCDKPLPSPPIARVVNSESPLEAQRTLVDAEAGTPTEEQWPIIRPENVSTSRAFDLLPSNGIPQRSVSEGSALWRDGSPALKTPFATTAHFVDNITPLRRSSPSIADNDLTHKRFGQMTEPRTFSSTHPYAKSFHAFSTSTEVAIESPLLHKGGAPPAVSIPPRLSSKRYSLQSSGNPQKRTSTPSPVDPSGSVKPGNTRWPTLNTPISPIVLDKSAAERKQEYFTFSNCTPTTQSQCGSIDSTSTRGTADGLSTNDETILGDEGTIRVKHLSWHPSNPGAGPTLRISAEADAVLLGRDESIPTVPALPESVSEYTSQERSLDLSVAQLDYQAPYPSSCSPSAAPSNPARSTPSQADACRSDPVCPRQASDCGDAQRFEHSTVDNTLKIRAKRSFRKIFHRQDSKSVPQPAEKHDSKRSSVTGSALAQRIKKSANLSKVSLTRPSSNKPNVKHEPTILSEDSNAPDKETNNEAALYTSEADANTTSLPPVPVATYETATIVHKILDRVTSMATDSPDRLCGLEIAEAVLHAAECSKQAKISAELARKNARGAELNARRAGVALKRLEKLCELGFNDETLQTLKQLITAAGVAELSEAVEE